MAYITKLSLKNFRSYKSLDVEFSKGINLIYGDNGQGKTNILEAINFLSLLKSFRTNRNKDLFHWEKESFFVGAILEEINKDNRLTLKINYGNEKKFFRDGYQVNQAVDFINNFQVVSFLPEDINLIKGVSSLRRSFLNITISKQYPDYLHALKNYNKLLKIRHHLFKNCPKFSYLNKEYLNSFDSKLIYYNEIIYKYRYQWFNLFKEKLKQISLRLFKLEKALKINYKTSINIEKKCDFKKKFHEILKKNLEKDYRLKVTHNGCHRDDFELIFYDKKINIYGSQGQCRLVSLALKLTVAEVLIGGKKNDRLILLIDDVLGELDEATKKVFFETMKKSQQVFITSTTRERFEEILQDGHNVKFLNIKDGVLSLP